MNVLGRGGTPAARSFDMNLPSVLAVVSISVFATVGCAVSSDTAGDSAPDESVSGSEDALTNTPEKVAQLDGLRARVAKDFPNLSASKTKLVLVVNRLHGDATKMAVQARIQKRDRATGKDSELSDADLRGSVYGELIQEGIFDGPQLTAILEKKGGEWAPRPRCLRPSSSRRARRARRRTRGPWRCRRHGAPRPPRSPDEPSPFRARARRFVKSARTARNARSSRAAAAESTASRRANSAFQRGPTDTSRVVSGRTVGRIVASRMTSRELRSDGSIVD
jgi:hypothetical protein